MIYRIDASVAVDDVWSLASLTIETPSAHLPSPREAAWIMKRAIGDKRSLPLDRVRCGGTSVTLQLGVGPVER